MRASIPREETFSHRGFFALLRLHFIRAARNFIAHDIPTVAAGAAFFILLAFFPAVATFVSLYGLFADVQSVREHLSYLRDFLPPEVLSFVGDEMVRVASTGVSKLSSAFLLSLILAIWSSKAGVSALITGLNVAYEQKERRGFIAAQLRALALTTAFGASILLFIIVVALPLAQSLLRLPAFGLLELMRWPILFVATIAGLAAIYHYGPSRRRHAKRRVLLGSIVASTLWLSVSLTFSWYLSEFAQYDKTYGPLGTAVGFMMWLWLGLMVLLFGAELNHEIERH